MDHYDVVVAGGGAAGFFGAIRCAERNSRLRVLILEQAANVLAKVSISGGGRCNLTNACFDPAELVNYYPRGSKELRGPFTRFQPRDAIGWFEARGVRHKVEPDGRVFPVTDSSQTVIDCLIRDAVAAGVEIRTKMGVKTVERDPEGSSFHISTTRGDPITAGKVLVATGGSPGAFTWLGKLGHQIQAPVPSLFTFTIKDPRLAGLAGVSVDKVRVSLPDANQAQTGALLVTHWGVSGPAVLKLSAWGARFLHEQEYHADLRINWAPDRSEDQLKAELLQIKEQGPRSRVIAHSHFGLPARLWERLVEAARIDPRDTWADLSKSKLSWLETEIGSGLYRIEGKSLNKEEFVTCGGVNLAEVDFKTMQSKKVPGLYLAGEVLDIDGLTGGFNFQSAWTTGWLAGEALGRS